MNAQLAEIIASGVRTMNVFDFDPDWRKSPKTDCYCFRCNRDLRPSQSRRWIHLVSDDTLAHPADLSKIVPAKGWPVAYPVGMDCAKIIGLEWTTEQQPLET